MPDMSKFMKIRSAFLEVLHLDGQKGKNEKKLAALSMLHKAKKAYYACNRVAARTGCAVHAPCLLAVRHLP